MRVIIKWKHLSSQDVVLSNVTFAPFSGFINSHNQITSSCATAWWVLAVVMHGQPLPSKRFENICFADLL